MDSFLLIVDHCIRVIKMFDGQLEMDLLLLENFRIDLAFKYPCSLKTANLNNKCLDISWQAIWYILMPCIS